MKALSPWAPTESGRTTCVAAVGVLVVTASWWGSANEPTATDQVPWLSAATLGFVVAAWAMVRWVLHGRVAVDNRIARVLAPSHDEPAIEVGSDRVVLGPKPARLHRPGCPLTAGRSWPTVDRDDRRASRRATCGVCRP